MTRRLISFALLLLILLVAFTSEASASVDVLWRQFKDRFITSDGRVVDWQNRHISHSEGQGYALLLAVELDDPAAFARVLAWSDNNLGRGLRPWKWGHSQDGWRALDRNNATDGDIFHAWALLLAGKKWDNPSYTHEGFNIMEAIRHELVDEHQYLLPARWGFQYEGETRLNLSYYVFPALRAFSEADPEHAAFWNAIYEKGLSLYHASLKNPAGLPPDWVSVDAKSGVLLPQGGRDANYGFEAIRIPLFLSWAHEKQALEPLRPFIERVAREGRIPQRISLFNSEPLSEEEDVEGGIGHYATLARAAQALGMVQDADRLWRLADKSREINQRNYYGEVLYLLSRIL